ncbi:MAG: hypothetical protein LBP24_02480 [Coriobacteriales bacterium]|jgi:hypothetical protein|nr:hypothetical protein [Coriobacteriales bacterium]
MMKIDYIWLTNDSDRNIFYDPHADRYYSCENNAAGDNSKQVSISLIIMPFLLFFLNSITGQFQQTVASKVPPPLAVLFLVILSLLLSELIAGLPSFRRGYPPVGQLQPLDSIVVNSAFVSRVLRRFQAQLYALLAVFAVPLCLLVFMLVFKERSLAFFLLLSVSIAVTMVVCRIVVRPLSKLKYFVARCDMLGEGGDKAWLAKLVRIIARNGPGAA